MVYIFYQHIIPKCKTSMIYFETQDYYMIFTSLLGVGVPCAYIWLCIFFGLFHCWTNFFGEVTRFADRRFYSDWWNAGNLSVYWRKWNYPIHNWLVRHCYFPLIRRGVNDDLARLLTFTVSAVFHEYIIIGIFRMCNLIAFTLMIVNIPVMHIQKVFKNQLSENLNNILFWIIYVIVGQPFGIMFIYYVNMRHTLVQ